MIKGFKKEDIRKYYLKGKVEDMLKKMMEEQPLTDKEMADVTEALEEIKEEEKTVQKHFDQVLQKDVEIPDIEDVEYQIDARESDQIKQWRDNRKQEVKKIKELMLATQKEWEKVVNKQENLRQDYRQQIIEQLQDRCAYMLSLRHYLSDYEIFMARKYNKLLVDTIDRYNVSRREAEDRAKATEIYQEYQRVKRLYDDIELIDQRAKKLVDRV